MPYALSDYAESGLFNHFFRNSTFAKPTTIAFALCTRQPSEYHNGATLPELPNAGNYSRVTNVSGDALWSHLVAGSGNNVNDITFAIPSADWGMVSGVAILDSATYGAGNMLMYGSLNSARDVKSGDTFKLGAGNVTIVFD